METLASGARELGLGLTARQLEQFEIYYKELIDWNKRINLTAITGYEEVQTKHFLDSLTLVLVIPEIASLNVIDIGTGAGLPGIPLKIAFPGLRLTLLEATAKKVRFLGHIVDVLAMNDVEIITRRAEELGHDPRYRERFGLVLGRAVAALPTLVELGLPLAATGGRLVAQKKGDFRQELEASMKAVETLGGNFRETVAIDIDGLKDDRSLIVIQKVRATPLVYPRRPGLPARRPIR